MPLDSLMKKVMESDFCEDELKSKRSSSITVRTCPYCQGQWKLNLNAEKGVFRCARCGESGNSIKLHSKLKDLSYEAAKEELLEGQLKPHFTFEVSTSKGLETASLNQRSSVYKAIIKNGYVSKAQADDLKRRGLTNNEFGWYATCSSSMKNGFCIWCKGIYHALIEYGKPVGIPGLFGKILKDENGREDTSQIFLNMPKDFGYLIPVLTHGKGNKQEISCMQVRHLKGELRYSFFTSGDDKLENGVSVSECNKVHYTRNFWVDGKMVIPETVNLTEGALKADVASVLSGQPFIAILGVNNTRDLHNELIFLKSHGCKKINVCFDMDYATNKNVEKALKEVNKLIISAGLTPRKITWDNAYKGIDDYLLLTKNKEKKKYEK